MDINKYLSRHKRTYIPRNPKIDEWLSWYRGKVDKFHKYVVYNGDTYVEREKVSLGMAKQICEVYANLLMNEKVQIVIPKQDLLDNIFDKVNFWSKANEGIEKSFALSKGAYVVGLKNVEVGEKTNIVRTDKAELTFEFVDALKIYEITVENKRVTEAAFVSSGNKFTNIVIHLKENGKYVIHNYKIYDDKEKNDEYYKFDTGMNLQWFYIIRPNISSNYLMQGYDPLGAISVYANAIDNFMTVDNTYDAYANEYVLGRKRMFVSDDATNIKFEGINNLKKKAFDPNTDDLFYSMTATEDGKMPIQEFSTELRTQAYVDAIKHQMSLLSAKCGLGDNYFKFDGINPQTATQVISENSTLYRNIKKHEIVLEEVLRGLTKTIIEISNLYLKDKFGDIKNEDIKIMFDDSIIEDKETEMKRDRDDVTASIMSDIEYRMKWYGEDENTAKENYLKFNRDKLIAKYSPFVREGMMTPKAFVDICYADYSDEEKNEMASYIENFASPFKSDTNLDLYEGNEE